MMKKIALGLSGGVDSAVAAVLLKEQGYDVTAVHLVCFNEPGCRADADRKDALNVALQLNLHFKVLDFTKEYREKVLGYFYDEYQKGRTPNPDIVCNQEIKFGLFYQWCLKNGFDLIATGHYCKNFQFSLPRRQTGIFNFQKKQAEKRWVLGVPRDKQKDQTYFLYRLRPEQLEHLRFPLGNLTKTEVRQMAKEFRLPVAAKKDSTGICFIGELNVRQFIKGKLGEKPGEVVTTSGEVIGSHNGYWFFTYGQSGGWEILRDKQTSGMKKLYVVDKDNKENRLVVGTRDEAMKDKFEVENLHWFIQPSTINHQSLMLVRIRHLGQLAKISNFKFQISNKKLKLFLEKPAFGVAPGQSAVFYQKGLVLGGGEIA